MAPSAALGIWFGEGEQVRVIWDAVVWVLLGLGAPGVQNICPVLWAGGRESREVWDLCHVWLPVTVTTQDAAEQAGSWPC